MRAGIVAVEEDAVRTVQCDGHIPATDGPGTHERHQEKRESHHVLCRRCRDCDTNLRRPHREVGLGVFLHEAGGSKM